MTLTGRVLTATVLTSLTVMGCSGGSSTPTTPKALAEALGCDSTYKADSTEEVFVQDVGTCETEGETVRLLTFADDDARDGFVKVAGGFGGKYVTGPKYAIEVSSTGTAKAVKAKL